MQWKSLFHGLKMQVQCTLMQMDVLKVGKTSTFFHILLIYIRQLTLLHGAFFAVERHKIKMKEKKFYSWLGIKYEVQLF